jgi:hypothetical protein
LLNILDVLVLKGCGKMPDTEIRLALAKSPGILAESGLAGAATEAARDRVLNIYCIFR